MHHPLIPKEYKMKNFTYCLELSTAPLANRQDNQLYVSADIYCPNSQLCNNHRCSYYVMCPQKRTQSSTFCTSHSCRECISTKSNQILAAVNKAPRNTCTRHQLCSFVSWKGKECNLVANGNSMYCREHNECRGSTNRSKPYNQFNQQVNTRVQQKTTAPPNKTCASLNYKRQPCKNKDGLELFEDNNWYCNVHKSQTKAKMSKASTLLQSSDSDISDDEEDETEIAADFPTELKPVLKLFDQGKVFSRIKCSDKRCNVFCLLKGDESAFEWWLCPVHQKPVLANTDKNESQTTVTASLSVPIEKMESKLVVESCEANNKKEVFSGLEELVVKHDVKADEKSQKGKFFCLMIISFFIIMGNN